MNKPLTAIAAAAFTTLGATSSFSEVPKVMYGVAEKKQAYTSAGADGDDIGGKLTGKCVKHVQFGMPFGKYTFNKKGDYSIVVARGNKCLQYKHSTHWKRKSLTVWSIYNPGTLQFRIETTQFYDYYGKSYPRARTNQKDSVITKKGSDYDLGVDFFEGKGPKPGEQDYKLKKVVHAKYQELVKFLNVPGLEKAIKGKTPKPDQKEIDDMRNL